MNSRRRAIFRSDASATIGGGHVVRSMALAQALAAADFEISFAVSDDTPSTVPELVAMFGPPAAGYRAMSGDDATQLAERWSEGIDVLVVDHYGLGADFERAARKSARLVVSIDDFPTRLHDCDILIDTTHGREAAEYSGYIPEGALALCGSAYALLREPFRRARSRLTSVANAPTHAMVTFGMTDSVNLTGLALEALATVAGLERITVVLGANAPHLAAVRNAVAARSGWCIVTAADAAKMAAVIADSDFILGAPGSASYERCCLGKPSLLVQLADNQADNAAALVAAGAACLLGAWHDIDAAAIAAAVSNVIAHPQRLAAMSAAAARLVDGDGVLRVRDAIEQRLA